MKALILTLSLFSISCHQNQGNDPSNGPEGFKSAYTTHGKVSIAKNWSNRYSHQTFYWGDPINLTSEVNGVSLIFSEAPEDERFTIEKIVYLTAENYPHYNSCSISVFIDLKMYTNQYLHLKTRLNNGERKCEFFFSDSIEVKSAIFTRSILPHTCSPHTMVYCDPEFMPNTPVKLFDELSFDETDLELVLKIEFSKYTQSLSQFPILRATDGFFYQPY